MELFAKTSFLSIFLRVSSDRPRHLFCEESQSAREQEWTPIVQISFHSQLADIFYLEARRVKLLLYDPLLLCSPFQCKGIPEQRGRCQGTISDQVRKRY